MSEQPAQKTAAILAIGDEILSGRTRDANIHFLAGWLTERGVALKEARIVTDDADAIASAVNALRGSFDYLFTSGGIGPTHDDITVDSIAQAFGVAVVIHPRAREILETYYAARDQTVTPARLRMARMPEGARLIENPVSGAPGAAIENVYVLAGVPRIFKAMLDAVDPEIERGARLHACAATARLLPESKLAEPLGALQKEFPDIAFGSYPIDGDVKGVTVIARGFDVDRAQAAIARVAAAMRALGVEPVMEDRESNAV